MLKSILSMGLAGLAIIMIIATMAVSADESKPQNNSANGKGVTMNEVITHP